MTKRCGYYVLDGKVYEHTVQIEWDLGYDVRAKHEYINRLHKELLRDFKNARIADVTTASPIYETRMLSPFFIQMPDGKLEDAWAKMDKPDYYEREFFYYVYCMAASDKIDVIKKYHMFTDIFHNPDTKYYTQATGCAVLRCLYLTNQMELLNSFDAFKDWCLSNIYFGGINWRK